MRLSLKCTAARHATKFHSGQSVSLPIRTLRKGRGTTAPKIQKLLKSIHPRDHGRRGARDGRTDLLPVFPVVNSHRASKQFILIARAPSSVPVRVRVVASSTETRARARISNHSRTNSNFQTAHLLGSPSTLGASSRRSTDLPARSRERHKKIPAVSPMVRFYVSRRRVARSFARCRSPGRRGRRRNAPELKVSRRIRRIRRRIRRRRRADVRRRLFLALFPSRRGFFPARRRAFRRRFPASRRHRVRV